MKLFHSFSLVLFVGCLLSPITTSAAIHVNQAGYTNGLPKSAVVESSTNLDGATFTLKSGGQVVYSGLLSSAQIVSDWGRPSFYKADFSDWNTPGSYTIEVNVNSQIQTSYPFEIGDNAIANLAVDKLMNYFREDRADLSTIWNKDAAIRKYGEYTGATYDVRGGWFDAAGDISKYLSHLSYANYLNPQQTPLTVWTMAFVKERAPNLPMNGGTVAGSAQSEALWGADFLLRMLDPQGYFYITVFDGWTGILSDRVICAFEGSDGIKNTNYQAAFREGAGMSIAALARISSWPVHGDSLSQAYLAGAEKAYAHLLLQNANNTCNYCEDKKENIIDDYTALLAASELYKATAKNNYIVDARARAMKLVGRLATEGYFYSDDARTRPFWHASDAGLPLVALARYLEVDPEEANTSVIDGMRKHLQYLVKVTNDVANPFGYARQTFKTGGVVKTGFFIPHDNESNYWWQGESARLGSLASAMFLAGRMALPNEYSSHGIPDSLVNYATNQLDWILGKNPMSMSFFEGLGEVNSPAYFNAYQKAGQLVGGIANGITGVQTDGTGIQFRTGTEFYAESWQGWRWEEQWLPHSTWFLMAIATMYDESPIKPVSNQVLPATRVTSPSFHLRKIHSQWSIRFDHVSTKDLNVQILDIQGRKLWSAQLDAGQKEMLLPVIATTGLQVVRVGNQTRVLTN